eukprot:58292-Amphidinium_carterae.1
MEKSLLTPTWPAREAACSNAPHLPSELSKLHSMDGQGDSPWELRPSHRPPGVDGECIPSVRAGREHPTDISAATPMAHTSCGCGARARDTNPAQPG